MGNALDATDNDHRQADCQYRGSDQRGNLPGIVHGSNNTVGLNTRQTEAHGNNSRHGKGPGIPFLAHGFFNVIGWATAVAAVVVKLFINLRQSGFNVSCGSAEKGHGPHPENGTWATNGDGGCDAGDITGANPSG